MKKFKNVIANIKIIIPTFQTTEKKAIECAENYELPKEYMEDSFNIVKVVDEDINECDLPVSRQKAIKIIEEVIEAYTDKEIDGKEYYDLEDNITKILEK